MKKIVGIMFAIIVIFVLIVVALATIDINRFGKDNLYVQIGEHTDVEETGLDSGQIAKRYWYELPAFDDKGEMTMVEFSAAKELRVDAYLKFYVKNNNEVTSYDEVQWDDIPVKAQEKLGE